MLKYIFSRPNETNSKSPVIVNGKAQSYGIISKVPSENNSLSINETSGLLSFTGSSNSQISYNLISGINSESDFVDYMYSITPIEIPFGSIPATSSYDIVIPNYRENINVEFLSGASITDLSGGFFGMIPVTENDVFSGSNITTNVIETDYYISNTIHSYSFSGLNLSVNYPIILSFPVTGVTESDFLNIKAYQKNGGGTIEEKTTSFSSYNSGSTSGTVFVELASIQNGVALVTQATNFTPFQVWTGNTMTQAANKWNRGFNSAPYDTTIYLQTPEVISGEQNKLLFWATGFTSQTAANNLVIYSDTNGTKYIPPSAPLGVLGDKKQGIYHVFYGWFIQINKFSQLVRVGENAQYSRQIIPVRAAPTQTCNGDLLYVVNASGTTEIRSQNWAEVKIGTRLIRDLNLNIPPYHFGYKDVSRSVNAFYMHRVEIAGLWEIKPQCCGFGVQQTFFTSDSGIVVGFTNLFCGVVLPLTDGSFGVTWTATTSAEGVLIPNKVSGLLPKGAVYFDAYLVNPPYRGAQIWPDDNVTNGTNSEGAQDVTYPVPIGGTMFFSYIMKKNTPPGNYTVLVYQNPPFNQAVQVFSKTFNDFNSTNVDQVRDFKFRTNFLQGTETSLMEILIFSDKKITPTPTPTKTPTPTPTLTPTPPTPPSFAFTITSGRDDSIAACALTPIITVYAFESSYTDGITFYDNNTNPFAVYSGGNKWYRDADFNVFQLGDDGVSYNSEICPNTTPTPTPSQTPTQTSTPTNTSSSLTQTPTPTNTRTPTQTPSNTGTPTQTPTETTTLTPTPTETSTPTPTMTPSLTPDVPLGECWSVTELYGNYSYVSYINRYGITTCETVGPFATIILCIQSGTSNAIQGYDEVLCTGNGVDYNEQNLGSNCSGSGDCDLTTNTPTPTVTNTPTPTTTKTPTPTTTRTPTQTPTRTSAGASPTPTPTVTSTPTSSPAGSSPTPTPTNTETPAPASPTPTPTQTRTPTRTPTPTSTSTVNYYVADKYQCSTCTVVVSGMQVKFPSNENVVLNNFYPDGNDVNHVYKIIGVGGSEPAYELTNTFGSFSTCSLACGN